MHIFSLKGELVISHLSTNTQEKIKSSVEKVGFCNDDDKFYQNHRRRLLHYSPAMNRNSAKPFTCNFTTYTKDRNVTLGLTRKPEMDSIRIVCKIRRLWVELQANSAWFQSMTLRVLLLNLLVEYQQMLELINTLQDDARKFVRVTQMKHHWFYWIMFWKFFQKAIAFIFQENFECSRRKCYGCAPWGLPSSLKIESHKMFYNEFS